VALAAAGGKGVDFETFQKGNHRCFPQGKAILTPGRGFDQTADNSSMQS
jgi:hypothetical protein